MSHRSRSGLLGALVATAAISILPAHASASTSCDLAAAPSGSDSAPGTVAQPFRSAQKLADSLHAGQAGCLRAGTYGGGLTVRRGGTSEAQRLTLTAFPGERAAVTGIVDIQKGANFVTVSRLWLDGRNAALTPSPIVSGNDANFSYNDVTNGNTGICFNLGTYAGARPRPQRTVIDHNRIHHCGQLPAANHDHGIYVALADDTKITGNWIHDNADRGIQLYPDAQRTVITGNAIDGNGQGVIFSGADGTASSNSTVRGNSITNSKVRNNVESWLPDGNPAGLNNVVTRNCIKGGGSDDGDGGVGALQGFTMVANEVSDPGYADRAAKDFRLRAGTVCASFNPYANDVPGPDGQAGAPVPVSDGSAWLVLRARPKLNPSKPVVRIKGSVKRKGAKRVSGRRVTIMVYMKGRWRRLARVRVSRSGRFSIRRRLRTAPHGRVIKLRAKMAGAQASRIIRVRIRR